MSTTIDFKLDSTEDHTKSVSTPKRKINELTYVTPDKEDTFVSSITIITQKSPEITSPEYKKRNVFDANDLDLTTTPIADVTTTGVIDSILGSSQPEPITTPGTAESSTMDLDQSQLLFRGDSQQRGAYSAGDTSDQLIPGSGLLNRSLSEPALSLKGGTLQQKVVGQDSSEIMDILLDIRTRMRNLEIKNTESVTNASLKRVITELHRPMQEAINTLQITAKKHEVTFRSLENSQLAVQSRTQLISQELKNHIDTTSAEYGELKVLHSDAIDQINEKIKNVSESSHKSELAWEDNCTQLHEKFAEMEKRIKDQETQHKQINDLLEKAKDAFVPQSEAEAAHRQNTMIRTHIDDVMRRSVIIEGIQENRGEDLVDLMLQISDALDIHLYAGEISQAWRIGRYSIGTHPRPVKITFIGEIKRDLFLQRKKHLANSERFRRVIMFPDDKPEIRKFKSHLRMAADVARKRGDQVWQRFNVIVVNGKKYEYPNYSELASDFPWPGDMRPNPPPTSTEDPEAPKTLETLRRERSSSHSIDLQMQNPEGEESSMETNIPPSTHTKGAPRKISKCRRLKTEEVEEMVDSLGSRRCVQITNFGIGFYTGECILSNHYKTKFVYNGRDHTPSEQAYFAECAIAAKDPASFKQIMGTNSPRRAKLVGERIIPGSTWNYIKHNRMYDINLARFSQNGFLKDRLLSTRGFTLIEASPNFEWASGSRLYSTAMSNGTWKGDNLHGFQLVDIREELYRLEQAKLLHK